MIVMLIHERNPQLFLGKFLGEMNAAKTGADDDNMLLICHNKPHSLSK